MIKKCSRCGGQVLSDLACLQCGADFKPITAYDLYHEHKSNSDDWVYPNFQGIDIGNLRKIVPSFLPRHGKATFLASGRGLKGWFQK